MNRIVSYISVFGVLAVLWSFNSCGQPEKVCEAKASQACKCGDQSGTQTCKEDGTGFDACQCSGTEKTNNEPASEPASETAPEPTPEPTPEPAPEPAKEASAEKPTERVGEPSRDGSTSSERVLESGPTPKPEPKPCDATTSFRDTAGDCHTFKDFCLGQTTNPNLPKFRSLYTKDAVSKAYKVVRSPQTNEPIFCETNPGYYYLPGKGYGICDNDRDGWINLNAFRAVDSTIPYVKANARCNLLQVSAVVYQKNDYRHKEGDSNTSYQHFQKPINLIETVRNDGLDEIITLPVYTKDQMPLPQKVTGTPECDAALDVNKACPKGKKCCTGGKVCYLGNCIEGRRFRPGEIHTLTKACIAGLDLNDNKINDANETPSDLPDPTVEFEPLLKLGYFIALHRGYYAPKYQLPDPTDKTKKVVKNVWVLAERERAKSTNPGSLQLVAWEDSNGFAPDYWRKCGLRDNQQCTDLSGKPKNGLSACWLKDVKRATPSLFKCVTFDSSLNKDQREGFFHPQNYNQKYNRTVCNYRKTLSDLKCTMSVCSQDSDCQTGEECRSSLCQPKKTCTSNSDCGVNQTCTAQKCTYSTTVTCSADSDCYQGQTCQQAKFCISQICSADSDCQSGEECRASQCQPKATCKQDTDCKANQFCISQKCTYKSPTTCMSGSECAKSQKCATPKLCMAKSCAQDSDCQTGEECRANECQPSQACASNGDCGARQVCTNKKCTYRALECTEDAQCLKGQKCQAPARVGVDLALTCRMSTAAPNSAKKEVGWASIRFKPYSKTSDYLASCIDEKTHMVCGDVADASNVKVNLNYIALESGSYGLVRATRDCCKLVNGKCENPSGVGVCRTATQTCSGGTWYACPTKSFAAKCKTCPQDTKGQRQVCANGVWPISSCKPVLAPSNEVCDNLDNDCDGKVDELSNCTCTLGATKACGSDTGECKKGTTTCIKVGGRSIWDPNCKNETVPAKEVCDGKDNDCDGQIDESYSPSPLSRISFYNFYLDNDKDGQGDRNAPPAFNGCYKVGSNNKEYCDSKTKKCAVIPANVVRNNDDCCDKDPDVKKGQTKFFGIKSLKCNTWDYNCSNREEKDLKLCNCSRSAVYSVDGSKVTCQRDGANNNQPYTYFWWRGAGTYRNSTSCEFMFSRKFEPTQSPKFDYQCDFTHRYGCGFIGTKTCSKVYTCKDSKTISSTLLAQTYTPRATGGAAYIMWYKNSYNSSCYYLKSGSTPKCGDTVYQAGARDSTFERTFRNWSVSRNSVSSGTLKCNTTKGTCGGHNYYCGYSYKVSINSNYYFTVFNQGTAKKVQCH